MIHLIGLVFNNGTGHVLYHDDLFSDELQTTLIWGLTQAITSFATVNLKSEGKLELIAGKYRILFEDPFLDLAERPEFAYTLVGIQDIYNNMDVCLAKLKKIHDLLLESGLDSDVAFLTFGTNITDELLDNISKIASNTSIFPSPLKKQVHAILKDFINIKSNVVFPLAVYLTDIDGGIISKCFSDKLIEDPSFTEELLNNMVAESPLDTQTGWLERNCAKSIFYSLNLKSSLENPIKEAFISLNLVDGKSDFCILTRVIFFSNARNLLNKNLQILVVSLYELLAQHLGQSKQRVETSKLFDVL